jgi:hypothetical protein
MSNENLSDELTHATGLDAVHRGELAELAFMRKAASLGFAVARPCGNSDRYDVVVRSGNTFWRVQIKSVLGKSPSRNHYRVQTRDSAGVHIPAKTSTSWLLTFSPRTSGTSFPLSWLRTRSRSVSLLARKGHPSTSTARLGS